LVVCSESDATKQDEMYHMGLMETGGDLMFCSSLVDLSVLCFVQQ